MCSLPGKFTAIVSFESKLTGVSVLCRSKIQGLGLYAARDLEKHTMVIEYIGEVIRSELSELREKQYEAKVSGSGLTRTQQCHSY